MLFFLSLRIISLLVTLCMCLGHTLQCSEYSLGPVLGLLLEMLEGLHAMPGIEPGLALCRARSALTAVLPSILAVIQFNN